jgi:cytochrome b pre-mRNA-processing protein 3
MFFNWLKRKAARKMAARRLYQTIRSQSRDPVLYAGWGVADTMDGRFDALCLYICVLIERLRRLGPEGNRLSQAVFDVMFRDVDQTLRETGVGDLGVPKHMAKMMKAFNGRAHVYSSALASRDFAALEQGIARNLYRAEIVPLSGADVAPYVLSVHKALENYSLEDFLRGDVSYPLPLGAVSVKEAAYA